MSASAVDVRDVADDAHARSSRNIGHTTGETLLCYAMSHRSHWSRSALIPDAQVDAGYNTQRGFRLMPARASTYLGQHVCAGRD